MPTRKISIVGLSGAGTVIVVWILSLVGLDMPPFVASAVTTVTTFALGYLIPDKPGGND